MKKEIKVRDLGRVVDFVSKLSNLVNTKTPSPILIKISVNRFNVFSVSITDLERFGTLNFPYEPLTDSIDAEAYITFADFKKYSAKLTGDADILFSTDENNPTVCDKLIIHGKKSTVTFNCGFGGDDYPSIINMTENHKLVTRIHLVNRRDKFIDLFDKLALSMSEDYVKPSYCGINFYNLDNNLILDSTDGKRLMYYETGLDFNQSQNLVIPANVINYILSIKKHLAESEIRVYGYELQTKENDGTISTKMDLGRLELEIYNKQEIHIFEWKDVGKSADPMLVIKENSEDYAARIVEVHESQIKSILDNLITEAPHAIKFDFYYKTISYKNSKVENSVSMLPEIGINDFDCKDAMDITVDKRFFLDAIKQCGICEIRVKNRVSPMYFNSRFNGNVLKCLLMPIRLNFNS